jgi:hypothetical protein
VTKLLKGISFIPKIQRTKEAQQLIVSIGQKDCANAFITERATEVLDYYGR